MPINERETDLATLFEQSTRRRSPRERMLDLHEQFDREQDFTRSFLGLNTPHTKRFYGPRPRALNLKQED